MSHSSIGHFKKMYSVIFSVVTMKLGLLLMLLAGCSVTPVYFTYSDKQQVAPVRQSTITKSQWIHGSLDCGADKQPAHDIYKHDENSFIIRQNKCLTFEAPFIYVLVGEQKILVLDTGDIRESSEYSLFEVLKETLGNDRISGKQWLVLHTHGHSDHFMGDSAFKNRPNVRLVTTSASDVHRFFAFNTWPQRQKEIDLGGRKIIVLPTPGHQEEAITLYDEKNKWLLTGDTLYPGHIYVKHWEAYRNSIRKLASFAKDNEIQAIFGGHIEMKDQPGAYYAIGSTYQPAEAQLDLSVDSLNKLHEVLKTVDTPTELVFNKFIIKPMGSMQKTISNFTRWVTQQR